jgi:hypothetical protein
MKSRNNVSRYFPDISNKFFKLHRAAHIRRPTEAATGGKLKAFDKEIEMLKKPVKRVQLSL